MLGGAESATAPILLEGRELIVEARVNGHAPMPFILDTGGHAILTTGAAKTLGLTGSGAGESGGSGSGTIALQYTRVKSIRIGNAELLDQPMLVIPYGYSFYERGKKAPLAGILGLEFFERYVTRIDYGNRAVTFSKPAAFAHPANGARAAMQFQDDMPMVYAAADGHRGLFGIDTGNSGSLILFGDYLKRTGLLERYRGGSVVIGHGTGGSNTGKLGTLHEFTIAASTVHGVPADFTQMSSGAFSSWTEAGNAGYEILSRFIPSFDYNGGILYLDKCVRECVPPVNRAGLGIVKNIPGAFEVTYVRKGSAAELAGILSGDRIIALNGAPASNFSAGDLRDMETLTATKLRVRIKRGAAVFDRVLILH